MTWYKVGLWPGSGYQMQVVIVESDSAEGAFAKAASMGYGDTMTSGQYEMYLNDIGVPPEKELDYEDERYSWFDDEGWQGYINMENAYVQPATPIEQKIAEMCCQPYYLADWGMYAVDPEGNTISVCGNCGKVSVEASDGSCPHCHRFMMRELNLYNTEDQRLFLDSVPSIRTSKDRKGRLFKSRGKKPLLKPLINLRRK